MSSTTTTPYTATGANASYSPSDDGRKAISTSFPTQNGQQRSSLPSLPTSEGLRQLLHGAHDEHGNLTKAALMVGIKLDLEAEVHLTARVRGDIVVGLY
ncbi:hypothetical protein BJ875DRAFT_483295 [Amylocarpus encephaloides]|uniref:Uncharacterized protein n=1 Tax=Amylocarpus encephaloides TaxID=45428 RepID=A0A9P7YKT9_9HELO|nr:hypothetical protein BJ875DRAFT_483295 [Amylocarpus encephaloides]